MQHTLGHIDCPGCLKQAFITRTEIARDLVYPEASALWIKSRDFEGGDTRARFLRRHSLRDLRDYDRPLCRFFSMLKLSQVHLGHFRQYQFERSSGLLGPSREDLVPVFVTRVARALKKTKEQVQADVQMMALVHAQVEAAPQREVGPNKINQELGMLIQIMRRAGAWTGEMDENYEPLQHQESDIPKALSPDEQEIFLNVAQRRQPFIHKYAILGIDCVFRTQEERELKIGDVNLGSGIVLVRWKSSKNKYSIRTIPLSDQAHWAMQGILERHNSLRRVDRDGVEIGSSQPQHYLMPFMAARGFYDPTRPMTVSGIKKAWDEVRREAGVPWFTPYHLRPTGLTRLAEAGTPIHVMLSMAGHISRRMQDHYIRISEQAKRRAVNRVVPAANLKLRQG